MGHCSYIFNPSEIYRRTKPGQGVETMCGALTFPAVDDPEIVPVRVPTPGVAAASYSYLPTGNMLPRSQDDPYCPQHGGSPEPPPPPVTMAQLQAAHEAYLQLAERFQHDTGAGLPELQGVPLPAAAEPPVTAEQLQQASDALAQLAAQAQTQGVTDGQ